MTLRTIAGLETPQRGRVVLNGRVLFDSASGVNLPSRRRRIGLLFQNYALFPHLTVTENIAFGLAFGPAFGADRLPVLEREARVARMIDQVHLRGLEDRFPSQLSGGQQQRVALARALAIQPEAILLDEPLSALDAYLQSQVETQLMEILRDFSGVVLYVTHNLEEAYRISRSLLVLAEGKDVARGAKEEIFRRPPTYAVARVTGCKNFSRVQALPDGRVEATDWGVPLRVAPPVPAAFDYVGIRAHHIGFTLEGGPDAESDRAIERAPASGVNENSFPCWLAEAIETPFRVTLYLSLNAPPRNSDGYHLQAEIFKDNWARLQSRPLPWRLQLKPDRLFLMTK